MSRQGNDYHAPAWFTAGLPWFPLDGEMWLERGTDENDVHRAIAAGDWHRLRLMVFDCPGHVAEKAIAILAALKPSPHMAVANFWQVESTASARETMHQIVARGGEGVMLRKPGSVYRNTRTSDLLKLKPRHCLQGFAS